MSNSPLVSFTRISPNKTSPRTHKIDTITIHCVVGQLSVESLGATFAASDRQASSNYGIGPDGRIGMYVEEKDRSWCSSNSANDNRAITIEVASDTSHPYAVKDAAYKALIDLLADICQRNNIEKLMWKNDKSLVGQVDKQNMTVHRWFAAKSCPGEYLFSRHSQIAAEVNARLGVSETSNESSTDDKAYPSNSVPFTVNVEISNLEIYKGPGSNYAKTGIFTGKGIFTIVEVKDGDGCESGWGKLKSGVGWIPLDLKNPSEETSTIIDSPDHYTKIVGPSVATVKQMIAHIKSRNPNVPQSVIDMIPYYISEGNTEGIAGDLAFAQSCIETGNFIFPQSTCAVTIEQNNFCMLGVTSTFEKGNSFATPQLGIRAQIQHLKAYASTEPLVGECVDPRFTYVTRGCAPYLEWLGMNENPQGKGWASGIKYGEKIRKVLEEIRQIKVEDTAEGSIDNSSEPSKPDTVEPAVPYCVKVNITNLNIRKGPGVNFAKTGIFTGKGIFTIVEVKEGNGSESGWGKLKSGAGWISLDYTEKV